MLYQQEYQSPLGTLLIVSNEQAVLGIWFENQKYFGSQYDLTTALNEENDIIKMVIKWLDDYFAGKKPDSDWIPLAPEVTPFREKVLMILKNIPYGTTITYQEIAKELEKEAPCSARAVGGAVGHNPISILIPCHRVVGSDGKLTGYAGGINRKIELLTLEGLKHSNLLAGHI